MPTIAIVDGILIVLYFNDHAPPHFHPRGAIFMRVSALTTVTSLKWRVEFQRGIAADYWNGLWPTSRN